MLSSSPYLRSALGGWPLMLRARHRKLGTNELLLPDMERKKTYSYSTSHCSKNSFDALNTCVKNTIFRLKYKYQCINVELVWPNTKILRLTFLANTNTDIFGSHFLDKYKYKYIWIYQQRPNMNWYLGIHIYMFHFQFLYPLSSFSVGYKNESNNANDSKKEDLSQQLGI